MTPFVRLIVCWMAVLVGMPVLAAPNSPTMDKAIVQAHIQRIEAALNEHKTAKGTFHQTNPDGTHTTGTFYLKRPHHMKFAYDQPKGHFIMAKKGWLIIHDPEFDEDSFVELEYTPAKFFLKNNISLTDEIQITHMQHHENGLLVTLRDREAQAEILLSFDPKTHALQGWIIQDPQGQLTRVALKDMAYGVDIPAHIFTHRKKIRKWDD